jgi:hypothetical protein
MSALAPPLVCAWDGESFVPKHPRIADKHYVIGENYPLVVHEDRSTNTHNHQFAWLHDAFLNLPEDVSDLYPTADHLRKRALIEAGYYNESIIDCGSKAGALRVAAHLRNKDDFALVIVRGTIVVERTAKSQSRRAMNREEFNDSKQKVLEIVAGMIGVTPESLSSRPSPVPNRPETRKPAAAQPPRIGAAAGTNSKMAREVA